MIDDWIRRGNWWSQSSCGRFTVSASRVSGELKYTAWRRPNEVLGIFETADEAKARCEKETEE